MRKHILVFLLVVLASAPFWFPLLQPGFFRTDDGDWMVVRLSAFHETIRSGQFPVRFLERLNHSYGYPVLDFLYPLPFYLGELIHIFGFNFVSSVKVLFLLSFLLSAVAMTFLAGEEWGIGSGLIAGIFYAITPYRLFDVYKRGSVGEAIAFIFPPLIFYFLQKLSKTGKRQYLALSSASLAALITAHNVVAFLFLPVIFGYLAFKWYQSTNQRSFLILSSKFLVLAFGLSAFFWFPALYDLQFTRAGQVQVANFQNYFLNSRNFLDLVGLVIPLIIFVTVIQVFRKKKVLLLSLLLITLLSIYLSVSLSFPIWSFSFLPRLVQFPWRFLSLTVIGGSLLLGYLSQRLSPSLLAILIILISFSSFLSLPKIQPTFHPDSYYSTNDDTTTVKNEYMPKWVKSDPTNRPDHFLEIVSGDGSIISGSEVLAVTPVRVRVSQVFFPGQNVFVDNISAQVTPDGSGLLSFSLPPGRYLVHVRFQETAPRLAADLASVLSLIVVIAIILPL